MALRNEGGGGSPRDVPLRRRSFLHALGDALRGIADTARSERHFRFHLFASLCVSAAGVLLGLSAVEWAILALTCGLVVALELVNTAVERCVDLASPNIDERARLAKDAAAGAVLVAAAVSLVVAGALLLPKVLARLG